MCDLRLVCLGDRFRLRRDPVGRLIEAFGMSGDLFAIGIGPLNDGIGNRREIG